MTSNVLGTLHELSHLILIKSIIIRLIEIEVQRDQVTCSRSLHWLVSSRMGILIQSDYFQVLGSQAGCYTAFFKGCAL